LRSDLDEWISALTISEIKGAVAPLTADVNEDELVTIEAKADLDDTCRLNARPTIEKNIRGEAITKITSRK